MRVIVSHDVRREAADRVHRRSGERAGPQAGKSDVGPDADGPDNADVLRSGSGSEDDAHQAEGQDRLKEKRREVRRAGGRVGSATDRRGLDRCLQE